jgi:hypothetical protein
MRPSTITTGSTSDGDLWVSVNGVKFTAAEDA